MKIASKSIFIENSDFRAQYLHGSRISNMQFFWRVMLCMATFVNCSGPTGSRSLALASPLWQDMACRDSVTFTTLYLSNIFLGRRRFAKMTRLGYVVVLFRFL